MKVARPAVRVRMSCASMAPVACSEISARMRRAMSLSTASSIKPLIDERISRQPATRILSATSAASAGSRIVQPVRTERARPTITPIEVATSAKRCQPSATSAGERQLRPKRMSVHDHAALRSVATALMARPVNGWVSVRGSLSVIHAACRISSAATMISTPSRTAEKYSALWWPNWWRRSAGRALMRIATSAAIAVTTLTMLSSASE